MATRLRVILEDDEFNALLEAAASDLRSPLDQARFLIRTSLTQAGLLKIDRPPLTSNPLEAQKQGANNADH